jgi:hypothetical protein
MKKKSDGRFTGKWGHCMHSGFYRIKTQDFGKV